MMQIIKLSLLEDCNLIGRKNVCVVIKMDSINIIASNIISVVGNLFYNSW